MSSPVGKTLSANIMYDNVDGSFEALLNIGQTKCLYTCRIYESKKIPTKYDDVKNLYSSLLNKYVTFVCDEFDENHILLVKLVN